MSDFFKCRGKERKFPLFKTVSDPCEKVYVCVQHSWDLGSCAVSSQYVIMAALLQMIIFKHSFLIEGGEQYVLHPISRTAVYKCRLISSA